MAKKQWTPETARAWISKVNMGREKFGLTFCSACDYLGISVGSAMENKPKKRGK